MTARVSAEEGARVRKPEPSSDLGQAVFADAQKRDGLETDPGAGGVVGEGHEAVDAVHEAVPHNLVKVLQNHCTRQGTGEHHSAAFMTQLPTT